VFSHRVIWIEEFINIPIGFGEIAGFFAKGNLSLGRLLFYDKF